MLEHKVLISGIIARGDNHVKNFAMLIIRNQHLSVIVPQRNDQLADSIMMCVIC